MKEQTLFSASFLSTDFTELEKTIAKVESTNADYLHFDVMDGDFVPVITYGHKMVADTRKKSTLPFDVHLMINKPEDKIEDFAEAGAEYITIQVEATTHVHRVVSRIRELGKKAGICLVPSTPVGLVKDVLPFVDLVLVMTVNPGYGGQRFIPEMLGKVRELNEIRQKMQYNYLIEVDGGIKLDTYAAAVRAGVDILVVGSAFTNADDPVKFVKTLKGL